MSNKPPLFSIILNNFNYAQYLSEAIDSALEQTYGNLEVIVVDDGSTDNSTDVIHSYGDRITYLEKKNGGQASAINAGYSMSSGELIIFLDSDDILLPNICEKIVNRFKDNRNASKFQFRLQVIDSSGEPTGGILPPKRINLPQGDIKDLIIRQRSYSHPPTSGNAFRREDIDCLMPIPEETYRKGAAAYLVYNSVLIGEIESIDNIGGLYRIHGKNITASNPYLNGKKLKSHLEEEICERKKQIEILSHISNTKVHEIGLSDLTHIKSRVVLKKLFPEYYTYRHTLAYLCFRGCIAAFLYSDLRTVDRPLWAGWFLAMYISPRYFSQKLVTQLTDHNKRSGFLQKILGNRDRQQ